MSVDVFIYGATKETANTIKKIKSIHINRFVLLKTDDVTDAYDFAREESQTDKFLLFNSTVQIAGDSIAYICTKLDAGANYSFNVISTLNNDVHYSVMLLSKKMLMTAYDHSFVGLVSNETMSTNQLQSFLQYHNYKSKTDMMCWKSGSHETQGLLYHVFGTEYDKVAAASIRYSRQFTTLPICVLTNLLPEERCKSWLTEKDGVFFIYLPLTVDDNRDVKTSLVDYTPFDQTVYIDSDAVIQKTGIDTLFDLLSNSDLVLQKNTVMNSWEKNFYQVHYKPLMKTVNVYPPMTIYQGGFFAFRKSDNACKFFNAWNELWKLGGCGRDMCAMCIAAIKCGVPLTEITEKDNGYFTPGGPINHGNPNAIVQHRWKKGRGFFQQFGIPSYKAYKPFDGRKGEIIYGS